MLPHFDLHLDTRKCAECGCEDFEAADKDPVLLEEIQVQDTQVISDDEDESHGQEGEVENDPSSGWEDGKPLSVPDNEPFLFSLDGPKAEDDKEAAPTIIVDEDDELDMTPAAEMLRMHYKFGHAPFSKLQEMAKRKALPKRLAKCKVPICSACQYCKPHEASGDQERPRTFNQIDQ
jgi:hypothetical protein